MEKTLIILFSLTLDAVNKKLQNFMFKLLKFLKVFFVLIITDLLINLFKVDQNTLLSSMLIFII